MILFSLIFLVFLTQAAECDSDCINEIVKSMPSCGSFEQCEKTALEAFEQAGTVEGAKELCAAPAAAEPKNVDRMPKFLWHRIKKKLKEGFHKAEEKLHEIQRKFNHGHYRETCIPGVFSYNGVHDMALELKGFSLKDELKVVKDSATLNSLFDDVSNIPRTPETWRTISDAISQTITEDMGTGSAQMPGELDCGQMIAMATHNPWFTAGMHHEEGKFCFDATKNSPNELNAAIFSHFDEGYAMSKLCFDEALTTCALTLFDKGGAKEYRHADKSDPDHTQKNHDFERAMRVFITGATYHMEMLHSVLHVYIYIMLGAANQAAQGSAIQKFLKPYERQVVGKYLEVAALLLGDSGLMATGWNVKYPEKVNETALKIFKFYAKLNNSEDWMNKFFFAGSPEIQKKTEILEEARKYQPLVVELADKVMQTTLDKAFHGDEDRVAELDSYLVDYLKQTDTNAGPETNHFTLTHFQQWIECQNMAGIIHGNTLGYTRLLFTDYIVPNGDWDTTMIEADYENIRGVAVGTLMGLRDEYAVNQKKPVENTIYSELMHNFQVATHAMQVKFWETLTEEDKEKYTWVKSVWGPNLEDSTQLTITSYV